MRGALTRKYGPVPLWVWIIGGVGATVAYAYYRQRQEIAPSEESLDEAYDDAGEPEGVTGVTGAASYIPGLASAEGIYDPTSYGAYAGGYGYEIPSMGYGSTSANNLTDIAKVIASIAAARAALSPPRRKRPHRGKDRKHDGRQHRQRRNRRNRQRAGTR